MSGNKHWSDVEVGILTKGFNEGLSNGVIANKLGRTTSAVQVKASKLSLVRNKVKKASEPRSGELALENPYATKKRSARWVGKAIRTTPPGFIAKQLSRLIGVQWDKAA